MKKLVTTLATLIAIVTLSTVPVMADINVTNDDHWVYVTGDHEFLMKTCGHTVYTKTYLNLRDEPNGNIIAVVPPNVELFKVGMHQDWSMIQIDGVNYFMATDYLTYEDPCEVAKWDLQTALKEAEEAKEKQANEAVRDTQSATGACLGAWTLTAYCNCSSCCGKWAGGATASGTTPTAGRTVACGSLPFGTQVYIEGLGTYVVEDRGVNGNWIDIYFSSHSEALAFGMQSRNVYLVG